MLIRKKLSLIEFGAIIGNVGLLAAIGLAII